MKFSIAGRSKQKLHDVLVETCKELENETFMATPMLICNVDDETDMKRLAREAKVVLNCVGPYRHFGEQVVKACVEAGCDYVDITGEPEFIERMEAKYHETAKATGALIVSTCGFDSIPCDLGVLFAIEEFSKDGGVASQCASFLTVDTGGYRRNLGHYATFECAVYGIAHANVLRKFRKSLPQITIPVLGPKMRNISSIWSRPKLPSPVSGYVMTFPGADASVVKRTMKAIAVDPTSKYRPVQFAAYFTVQSRFTVFAIAVVGTLLTLLAKYSWGRWFLLKYPYLCTLGAFSHSGPTEEMRKKSSFQMCFVTKGWRQFVDGTKPFDKVQVTAVSGPEAGYIATPIIMVQSALTILEEKKQLKVQSGCVTPATAFQGSSLVTRLTQGGVTFKLLSTGAV